VIHSEWASLIGAAVIHAVGVPVAYVIAPEPPPIEMVKRNQKPYEVEVDVDDAFNVKPRSDRFRFDQAHGGMPAIGMRDSNLEPNPNFDPNLPRTFNRGRRNHNGEVGEDLLTAPEGAETDNGGYFNPDGSLGNAPGPGEVWGIPGADPDLPIWAYPGAPGITTDGGDGPAAPTRTKKRKYDPDAATKAVADGVRKNDRKLGLDFPGRGPIRSAFVSATYSSDAPYECQAVFGVAVNPKGKVTSVKYVTHTGGSAGTWRKVGKTAFGALKSAKLVMKSAFKKGATVSVVITSKKKTPGGGASRDGATINFDVTDVGAKATRVVSASVQPTPVK
jgi:hypothetical protein